MIWASPRDASTAVRLRDWRYLTRRLSPIGSIPSTNCSCGATGGQYDKVVFLDSDMLITSNIDFLFDRPDFSACQAGHFLNPDWVRLNSGLMVIEPNDETFRGLMAQLAVTLRRYAVEGKNVGDQDVINDYMPDWPDRKELHLPDGLNMFFKHLTLARAAGYSFMYAADAEKRISVVHFIGAKKPWHLIGVKRAVYPLKVFLKNRYGLKPFLRYMRLLKGAAS